MTAPRAGKADVAVRARSGRGRPGPSTPDGPPDRRARPRPAPQPKRARARAEPSRGVISVRGRSAAGELVAGQRLDEVHELLRVAERPPVAEEHELRLERRE